MIIKKIKNFFEDNFSIEIESFGIKLKNILKTTSFNYMKDIEIKNGFDEAMPWGKFFRKGKKEQWKDILNKKQILKIEENFSKYMSKFDYY